MKRILSGAHRRRLPAYLLFLSFFFLPASHPAFAQVDLSGTWQDRWHEDAPERDGGPEIGDYTGMPVNDAARMRADSWDAQKWEVVEHMCDPHPADYGPRGPAHMRVWSQVDPFTQGVVAWHLTLRYMITSRTIYMDGRPHPSANAPHTWQGFSTGEWEGDMLKVTTTHLKEGWFRRNGLARSDRATLIEYFIRHDDYFTLVTDVEDPIYATEPFIRTSNWVLDLGREFPPRLVGCIPSVEVEHPEGYVAYHTLGENHFLGEYPARWGVPAEAARGGAETMYPEYQEKLAKMPSPPTLSQYRATKQ